MIVRFCDELGVGFGWIVDEFLERCSHALEANGSVWLIDPVDAEGVEQRVRELGRPAGVVQLLQRHSRDGAALAERLAVPLYEVPFGGIPGSPFDVVPIADKPGWREAALWWPAERVLVCGDALGTASYFRAGRERLAVHPLLRLTPPRELGALDPRHILVGHGEGVHGDDAAQALRDALASARRRLPAVFVSALRRFARRG